MDTPITPTDAANWLWQIGHELDKETRELAKLRQDYVNLLRAHRLAYANAYLSVSGTVEDRKQKAAIETMDERMALEMQEQLLETSREKLRTLRDRSEIGRCVNANLKEEMRTVGTGAWHGPSHDGADVDLPFTPHP